MLRSPSMRNLQKHRPWSGRSARRCTATALLHFCQCRRGFRHLHQRHSASCIRAPPEAEKQISGQLSPAPAQRHARNAHLPQTPWNPHKGELECRSDNRHSIQSAFITTSASFSPVSFCADARRSFTSWSHETSAHLSAQARYPTHKASFI